jgi:SpoVK/Ycf46/Vps4 family AAA+-type ATPase
VEDSQNLVDALRRAVEAAPDDTELRIHFAELLIAAGHSDDATAQLGIALGQQPANARVHELLRRALGVAPTKANPEASAQTTNQVAPPSFDWSSAESEVADIVGPAFVDDEESEDVAHSSMLDERPVLRLADVGGMGEVKKRLENSFLLPLRNPELSKLYSKSLRGGLLLYGPPGCGKTYIARAIAGELGAKFFTISIADILDPFLGKSERNLHDIFQYARRHAPCVLFIDEVDALGQRRNSMTSDLLRGVVNQMLTELDGVSQDNEGVFVLAATNQPWDVDPALRRPGRLDRTVLVVPPDEDARAEIFRHHLEGRPVENVELKKLAKASDGLSGADIAYVCELASEFALEASVASGTARMIGMPDLLAALAEVPASTVAWLSSARNFVEYGQEDPAFDELRKFLRKSKRL